MKEKTKPNLVKCPYCGSTPVMGTLVTTYSYVSEHCLRENGIDIEDKSNRIGAMLGDMSIEPTMRITKYKCLSCQKEWGTYGKRNTYLSVTKMDYVILKRGRKHDNH